MGGGGGLDMGGGGGLPYQSDGGGLVLLGVLT